MPRVNPYSLKRPVRTAIRRVLTDSAHPDQEFEFALRRPDAADLIRAAELSQAMIERYLTGGPNGGPFPYLVDDQPQPLNERLIDSFCAIAVMQPAAEELGWEPYTPEEIGQFAFKAPDLWDALNAFVRDVMTSRPEAPDPKASGASTEVSSETR